MELDPRLLIPEIILLVAACLCTLLGLSRSGALRRSTQIIAALACALAACASATEGFGIAPQDGPTSLNSAVHYT